MELPLLLFYVFGFLALSSAVAMVCFVRHPVAGAMSLLVTVISLSAIYVLLEADFVAVVQLLVFAGAVGIVLLLAIVLLGLRADPLGSLGRGEGVVKAVAAAGALTITAILIARLPASLFALRQLSGPAPEGYGGYRALGRALYGEYLVPVEAIGVILLAALVGAVILAKRRID
jgi:NADH-quinone oxidoreductase subunit J